MSKLLKFHQTSSIESHRNHIAIEYAIYSTFISLATGIILALLGHPYFALFHLLTPLFFVIAIFFLQTDQVVFGKIVIAFIAPFVLLIDNLYIFTSAYGSQTIYLTFLVISFLIYDRNHPVEKILLHMTSLFIPILYLLGYFIQLNTIQITSHWIYTAHFLFVVVAFGGLIYLLNRYFFNVTRLQNNLFSEAKVDFLTRIFNRRYFQEMGNQLYNQSKQLHTSISVIIFDIDFFKTINDTYGHPFGDKVLKEVCKAVTRNLRSNDVFARYGGEEFCIILNNTTVDSAFLVAEKLREAINMLRFKIDAHTYIGVQASFGIASTQYKHYTCFDDLVNEADQALYLAKNTGRNKTSQIV